MFAFPIPYWGPQSWSSTRWIAWSPAASLTQNLNWMEAMEGSEYALDKLHDCVTDSFLWGCVKIAAIFGQGGFVTFRDMGFQAASWPCSGSTVTWSSHDMGLSENSVPRKTQWFCWSLSLLNGYFIGNIPNIFRQTHINTRSAENSWRCPASGGSACCCLAALAPARSLREWTWTLVV